MKMKKSYPKKFERAQKIFHDRGGMLKTGEALSVGIHPRTLYEMHRTGILEQLTRGLYRLADLPPLGNPDLVSVSLKIPNGVICLISALAYMKSPLKSLTRFMWHWSEEQKLPDLLSPRFESSGFQGKPLHMESKHTK